MRFSLERKPRNGGINKYRNKNYRKYKLPDNICNFNRTHKKNHTTNICKNIEEIIKKKSLINHKRNQIIILNSVNKKNNKNFQIKFKTPSKTIIQSLELNKNKNINTNCKNEGYAFLGKFNINNNITNLRMKKRV